MNKPQTSDQQPDGSIPRQRKTAAMLRLMRGEELETVDSAIVTAPANIQRPA
jgi:hypothetical protein